MEQLSLGAVPQNLFSVTELTAAIHRLLSNSFEDVRIAGEISGYKVWTSGHAYFTLKDSGAQLKCVLFKGSLRYMKFKPQDGLAVVARGTVEVRQERGEYQLIVSSMEPQGAGALQFAFEQLKQKLAAEGLFAQERKRELPAFPRRIGIITSPRGAVIRDMLSVLTRRFPGLHIRVWPTLVQGAGACDGVCSGLRYFSESGWAEVVILGRGGGSVEDLWTFNEEDVARAIAASSVPVVSAVGHETDFTIADFVADLRAPTPSAAAELVVRNLDDLIEDIDISESRIQRSIHLRIAQVARRLHERGIQRAQILLQRRVGSAGQRLDDALNRLRVHDPRVRLARTGHRFEAADQRLLELARRKVTAAQSRFAPLASRLEALSPVAILERGYSIIQSEEGRIVRSPRDAPPGTTIQARLAQGKLTAKVEPESAG